MLDEVRQAIVARVASPGWLVVPKENRPDRQLRFLYRRGVVDGRPALPVWAQIYGLGMGTDALRRDARGLGLERLGDHANVSIW